MSKPVKHRNTNTFRFVPFSERVNEIDIRHAVLYHIPHANLESPQEHETHFNVAIRKWYGLNLSENFKKFKKEVFGVITITQLLHKKQYVCEVLKKYLLLADPLCLQPLLEILVSLAKDLREEFYPVFPMFFNVLIDLLKTKDADQLEWTIVCLTFIFKLLKPHLMRDFPVVWSKIIPLLSESEPQYINHFAAQSFAFVARDIKDKKKFLSLILSRLEVHEDAITGTGHLIFEIMRGVSGKFHSCALTFWPTLLEYLKNNEGQQNILFKVLTQTVSDMLETISPKDSSVFWDSVIISSKNISNKSTCSAHESILRLAGQALEFKNGQFLPKHTPLVSELVMIISNSDSQKVMEVCSQIAALLLLSPNMLLTQEQSSVLVRLLLTQPSAEIQIRFVQKLINYSQFEMLILPHFLSYAVKSNFDDEALHTLANICLSKAPLSKNGIKLFDWVKYPINLGKGLLAFRELLTTTLHLDNVERVIETPDTCLNALICLPHIENIDVDYSISLLNEFISKLLSLITDYPKDCRRTNKPIQSKFIRRLFFILSHAVESALHVSNCKKVKSVCNPETITTVLLSCAADPQFLCALQALDLYLTAYEHECGLSYPLVSLIDSCLKNNLVSQFHVIRLLTTHIYKLFEGLEELKITQQYGEESESLEVFTLCYNIESIRPSVQEYRTQLNMLQKMSFSSTQFALLKKTDFSSHALLYMFGVLNLNFKLLWEPTIEFIIGYANGLAVDQFWAVFNKLLQDSFETPLKMLDCSVYSDEFHARHPMLEELYTEFNDIPEQQNCYNNYRTLLLQIMTSCIHVCESKNRDVATVFLKFINNEYKKSDNANALKTDVLTRADKSMKIDVLTSADENIEIEELPSADEDMEIDASTCPDESKEIDEGSNDNVKEVDTPIETKDNVSGKITFKTLIGIMQVISKFKNPRALHREAEFWNLYMEFLCHKNAGLQKYALECVLNYKNKSVTPYKDHLLNLADDKKFKGALTVFQITKNSDIIQPDDRSAVMPIILRILYGKMISKLGPDKKGGGQVRRSLVMRHLAGCQENELNDFILMAFSYFKTYMDLSPLEIYQEVNKNLDLKSITSPSKLHSTLNLFEVVREYFAGCMSKESLHNLFKVFYAVCATSSAVLAKGELVHVGYVKVMKNLRVIALSIAIKLFGQFDRYPWSKEELQVLFESLVWPLLPKLHIEGIHSPTVLLKLFNVWCQNPRYFVLLVTCHPTDSTLSPLPYICKLLLSGKANLTVVNVILEMIENLLSLKEGDEEEEPTPPIVSFNMLPMQSQVVPQGIELNFGSKILIPCVPEILEIIKRRVTNSTKTNTVNKRDLFILSRITELVSSTEISDELLHLLLPILVKKICMNMAEDNMGHAVTTIINLLERSTNPQNYIKSLAILFYKVSPVEVRKALCKMLDLIGKNSSKNNEVLKRHSLLITEMNAYSKKWIEQPDYDRRLDAFKQIYQLSEIDQIDIDLAVLIVNNCFYFIRTEKDLSLRDMASLCLTKILPKLLLKYKSANDGTFLVRDTVLSLISTGIRDYKNDVLRNNSIALLGELTRECPSADVVLSDLALLANKEDREVDFFDNLTHLQMHRKVRALLKFCKVSKSMLKCPAPRTLTNFIIPLASMHLCDEKYTDKNSLIDACIDVVCTCCRLLPWYHYEVILKHYISKMRHSSEYQKQVIRLLVGILNAFHFDLSKAATPKCVLESKDEGIVAKVQTDQVHVDDKEKKEGDELEESEQSQEQDIENLETDLKEADQIQASEASACDEKLAVTFDKLTVCSPSVAKRIIKSLTSSLLPQLNRAIFKMTEHEESHKVNRRRMGLQREEQDILRVPIALALVKLLQQLPGDILRTSFPGIIIKLCSFLKSPLKQVRIAARDIVKKIMIAVGTSYLGILLEYLTLLLTRGFQAHALVATIHTVLDALKSDFKSNEIDVNLKYILNVCINDLFGSLSEEKEVEKLHYKTPEAKPSEKTYVTLTILAENITDKCLVELLVPFKKLLEENHSKKVVLKVQKALTHIARGLVSNDSLDVEPLLIFLYAVASESIPDLTLESPASELTEEERKKKLREKLDCYLLQNVPKRNRESRVKQVRTSAKANAHVLVEFSLNMLYVILKRNKITKDESYVYIDPLVVLIFESLQSDHVNVTKVALECLTTLWTLKIVTPTLTETIKDFVHNIFSILHKYATFGISKQDDNFFLVKNAFKATTVLIRNVRYYTLETDQLKTLLLYAEQDCQNDEKQPNSFALLKAILEARLVSPELHEVMDNISKISITSGSANSRDEARMIFMNYLTKYSLGKKIEQHMHFFVSQLNYELQHGRESSLKLLEMIINKFPLSNLAKYSEFLLTSLGMSMVNDDSPECRASAALCLEAMLRRSPALERNKLFQLTLTFFKDRKPAHIELGAQLCSRFVIVEAEDFKKRLDTTLSTISSKLQLLSSDMSAGRFVILKLDQDSEKTEEEKQKEKDHSLIQVLILMDKLAAHCPSCLTLSNYFSHIDNIAEQCQILLAYPHSWVRLKAATVISQILNGVDPLELNMIVSKGLETERTFIYRDTLNTLKSLVLDFCAQFTVGVEKQMSDQAATCIFQIFKFVHSIQKLDINETATEDDNDSSINIKWIIWKLRRAINVEVTKSPMSTNIRTSILTMLTHIISLLSKEDLDTVLDRMMVCLVRELTTTEAVLRDVRQLVSSIGKKLRRKLGDLEYSKLVAVAQTKLNIKRAARKKLIVQEKVVHPERAAKRKLQLNDKKKAFKKKKIEMLQGKRVRSRKRKTEDMDSGDEF